MNLRLEENFLNGNNGFALNDSETERYISVLPNENQLRLWKKPFYTFIHFGMNTATGREWGTGTETVSDFDIKNIDAAQWVSAIKASGATGIILTCKHHDGFCLWNTAYTDFNVMNTTFGKDIVALVSAECKRQKMKFGVYLSPWDMHEKTYGQEEYNDYFISQLTELLTKYGEIFEVWFDGAKGKDAKAFQYDWLRYYELVRKLQPNANIAICGPDVRWVGNEAGKTRKSEFCVVPKYLALAETVEKNSQHAESEGEQMKKLDSMDEDLGSRKVLSSCDELSWYPAEVDVSIRKGWFHRKKENRTVKSASRLFKIYMNSVGNNCTLLLNIPPNKDGVIDEPDVKALKKLGEKINSIHRNPVLVKKFSNKTEEGYIEFDFKKTSKVKYCVLSENITKGQRIEKFDLYLKKPNGKYSLANSGTIIGMKKIIKLKGKAVGAVLVIRQSRSEPYFKEIGFYE